MDDTLETRTYMRIEGGKHMLVGIDGLIRDERPPDEGRCSLFPNGLRDLL